MIIFFGFFCITIFPEKSKKIKNKVGITMTFLLMTTILKAKSTTQVHFRLGQNERIPFEKTKTNKQTLIERKAAEGTSTSTQLRLNTPCYTMLGTGIRCQINFAYLDSSL
jgi:hypothetical protein